MTVRRPGLRKGKAQAYSPPPALLQPATPARARGARGASPRGLCWGVKSPVSCLLLSPDPGFRGVLRRGAASVYSQVSGLCARPSRRPSYSPEWKEGKKTDFKGLLIRVGHAADRITTSSFGSHNTVRWYCYGLISQSSKLRLEAVNNVHKVTQLISGRAGIRTQCRLIPPLPARSARQAPEFSRPHSETSQRRGQLKHIPPHGLRTKNGK